MKRDAPLTTINLGATALICETRYGTLSPLLSDPFRESRLFGSRSALRLWTVHARVLGRVCIHGHAGSFELIIPSLLHFIVRESDTDNTST